MTEDEWLASADFDPLLRHLGGRASKRKSRLFAAACCRQIWKYLPNRESREAVEAAERFADGEIEPAELRAAGRRANDTSEGLAFEASVALRMRKWAERDAAHAAAAAAQMRLFPGRVAANARAAITATPEPAKNQAALLRDIFGNPFRPATFDPNWRTDTALSLARVMYETRDFAAMPILADALQDAGSEQQEILDHSRDPNGVHVRGCWVVDLVLGKA
jgi:hypothetical protein